MTVVQIGRKSVPSILPNYTCTHFVDREMYSQKLHDFFKPWPRVRQMFVLWGLGGIGYVCFCSRSFAVI